MVGKFPGELEFELALALEREQGRERDFYQEHICTANPI